MSDLFSAKYVIDGESGLLAPEKDREALTEILRKLLTTPESWAQMGRRGRQHVEREYDARRQVQRLEEIYDELVSE